MTSSCPPPMPDPRPVVRFPAFLYGLLIMGIGFGTYLLGVLLGLCRIIIDPDGSLRTVVQQILWYSGIPVVIGFALLLVDLFVLLPKKRTRVEVIWNPPVSSEVTVVLTAYNDESSIGLAVQDFQSHP